jgi:hypothetical protein
MGFLLGILLKFSSLIKGAFFWFIMFLSIAIILTVTVFVIKYVHIIWIAVIISTICSCFLMVPVIWGFNNIVDSKGGKGKIKPEEIEKRDIVIEGLENTIRNLENSMFNVQGFEKILELGLLETNLKQSTITRKRLDEKFSKGVFGIGAGGEYYEYLEVMTHDIVAKFGVDLKSIRLSNSKQHSDTIAVSGIAAKFLGTTKIDSYSEIQEIRRIKLDGNKEPEKIDIMDSKHHKNLLIEQMKKSQRKYQQRLNQGLETTFMDKPVIKLAENFIKLFLAPLNKKIIFLDGEHDDGLLFLEYLEVEKRSFSNKIKRIKKNSPNIA